MIDRPRTKRGESLNAREAAERLGVCERTVRRAIKAGRLSARKVNAREYAVDLDAAFVACHGPERVALEEALETLREVGYGGDADEIVRRYGL